MTDYEPAFQAYERLTPLDPSATPVAILVAGAPGAETTLKRVRDAVATARTS